MQQSKQRLTLQLELPASVSISEQQATEILVLKLLEDGVLSQSEAAHALGISRAELIERMHQTRVPVVAYTPEDYLSERATLQWLQEQRKRQASSRE